MLVRRRGRQPILARTVVHRPPLAWSPGGPARLGSSASTDRSDCCVPVVTRRLETPKFLLPVVVCLRLSAFRGRVLGVARSLRRPALVLALDLGAGAGRSQSSSSASRFSSERRKSRVATSPRRSAARRSPGPGTRCPPSAWRPGAGPPPAPAGPGRPGGSARAGSAARRRRPAATAQGQEREGVRVEAQRAGASVFQPNHSTMTTVM